MDYADAEPVARCQGIEQRPDRGELALMARRGQKFTLWRSGGVQLGEVRAVSDSRALLDYAASMGIADPVLRGSYTLAISPTEKVYVVPVRD